MLSGYLFPCIATRTPCRPAQFGDITGTATGRFVNGNTAFDIVGARMSRNAAIVDLGVSLMVPDEKRIGLIHGGRLGGDNRSHSARLSISFAP